jgi:hypothetical protein
MVNNDLVRYSALGRDQANLCPTQDHPRSCGGCFANRVQGQIIRRAF